MRMCSLASGSNGNSIFAGSDTTSILIDAGVSGKKIEQGLNSFGFTSADVDAVFITHEHSDHIKCLGVFARKYGKPIYATRKTWNAILNNPGLKAGKIPEGLYHEIRADEPVTVGDLSVKPFSISHDAADPVGYRVENGGKSCAVATDMGCYSQYTLNHLRHLDAILLEANHDVNMLEAGRYPYPLKMRILSDKGHLSNETCGQLLSEILHDDMKYIMLGHLSAENNYPQLAYETVSAEVTMGDNPYTARDFPIEVAKRGDAGQELEW